MALCVVDFYLSRTGCEGTRVAEGVRGFLGFHLLFLSVARSFSAFPLAGVAVASMLALVFVAFLVLDALQFLGRVLLVAHSFNTHLFPSRINRCLDAGLLVTHRDTFVGDSIHLLLDAFTSCGVVLFALAEHGFCEDFVNADLFFAQLAQLTVLFKRTLLLTAVADADRLGSNGRFGNDRLFSRGRFSSNMDSG